jgi:hypothetical protein
VSKRQASVAKKNNATIFLPQPQPRQGQDLMTAKQVQGRRNGFNVIQADSKMTKQIPRQPSRFDNDEEGSTEDSKQIPRRRRGFNESEADITTTTHVLSPTHPPIGPYTARRIHCHHHLPRFDSPCRHRHLLASSCGFSL